MATNGVGLMGPDPGSKIPFVNVPNPSQAEEVDAAEEHHQAHVPDRAQDEARAAASEPRDASPTCNSPTGLAEERRQQGPTQNNDQLAAFAAAPSDVDKSVAKLSKYEGMVKLGVPFGAIIQRMTQDGILDAEIAGFIQLQTPTAA